MIQIGHFVHRLGDRQAKIPLLRSELFGCDGNGLVAVGLAVDSGRDQVAQAAAAQEVSQADETRTVPREKHRATARLAVVLGEHPRLFGGIASDSATVTGRGNRVITVAYLPISPYTFAAEFPGPGTGCRRSGLILSQRSRSAFCLSDSPARRETNESL